MRKVRPIKSAGLKTGTDDRDISISDVRFRPIDSEASDVFEGNDLMMGSPMTPDSSPSDITARKLGSSTE